jgi:hypothetical protein
MIISILNTTTNHIIDDVHLPNTAFCIQNTSKPTNPSEVRLQPHPMHCHELYAGIAFGLFVSKELLCWILHEMGIWS